MDSKLVVLELPDVAPEPSSSSELSTARRSRVLDVEPTRKTQSEKGSGLEIHDSYTWRAS